MVVAFEFKMAYASPEFCFLLSKFSQNLLHEIDLKDDLITLFVEVNEDLLSSFSNFLSENLPHSIFLKDFRIYIANDMNLNKNPLINSISTSKITPSVINSYKNNEFIKNEFGVFSKFILNEKEITSSNFKESVDEAVNEFLNKKSLNLKDENKSVNIEFLNFNCDYIVPTNLKNLPKIFIANEKKQVALASFEKPVVRLKTTALFRQNNQNAPKFYDVKAADDIFLYAFCDKLYKKGINFISIKYENHNNLRAVILDDLTLFNIKSNKDKIKALNLNFNTEHKDKVEFRNAELLFLPNYKSFDEIIGLLKKLPNGETFIKNFSLNFKLPNGDINLPSSFFSLLCIVGVAIGLDSDFKKAGRILLENAADFNLKSGVSIECGYDKNEFNSVKFIKSAMSFYLAGAGVHNISFGCIQSLAIFFSDFCYRYANELGFTEVTFSGDLFDNELVSELFFKHINPNLDITFSEFIKI